MSEANTTATTTAAAATVSSAVAATVAPNAEGPPLPINVVITTCMAYAPFTVPPLVKTMLAAGVPPDAIHVVVGESRVTADAVQHIVSPPGVKPPALPGLPAPLAPVQYHYVPYCNIDNNGLMWLTQSETLPLPAEGWIMLLHDTCLVASHFWDMCGRVVADLAGDADAIMMHLPFSMGIGFYRLGWLRTPEVVRYMRSLCNVDPANIAAIKANAGVTEDTLFKYVIINGGKGKLRALKNTRESELMSNNPYGTNTPRLAEYYAVPGVYKLKANWAPQGPFTTNL